MSSDDSQDIEIELLKKISAGDRESFSQLYDRIAPTLFTTAYNVTHQREATEEVVQDVFVQIWKNAALYNPSRGKPVTWAIVLTRNKAIDYLRSVQRRARLLEERQDEIPAPGPAEFQNSAYLLALTESAASVRKALEKLPENQRTTIELIFLSGLSTAEVAKKLGEGIPTIKARLRRGLMRLRTLLEKKI